MAVITKVYGGRAIISFNEARHYYTVTALEAGIVNRYQPGVTSIIGKLDKSGALVHWAVEQMATRLKQLIGAETSVDRNMLEALIQAAQDSWREAKDNAAGIGSLVHRVIEERLSGGDPQLPLIPDPMLAPHLTPEMIDTANRNAKKAFEFLDEHKVRVVQIEQPRWSATHGYVGTGDFIGYFDDKLSVLDWKNGKRLYPTIKLQTAAYKRAWEEEYPDQPIEQRIGVNIGRTGEIDFQVFGNDTFDDDLATFLALLRVWRWDRPHEYPTGTKTAPELLTPAQLSFILPTISTVS
jgi:hypothetical protein